MDKNFSTIKNILKERFNLQANHVEKNSNVFVIDHKKVLKKCATSAHVFEVLSDNNILFLNPEISGEYILIDYIDSLESLYDSFDKKLLDIYSLLKKLHSVKNMNIKEYLPLDFIVRGQIMDIYTLKPELKNKLQNIESWLNENLFVYLPYMEKTLAHGDLHPSNILCKDGRVEAFIDWELSGYREELYDLAFIVGCIGMDDPENLTRVNLKDFIAKVINNMQINKLSWLLFIELMVAIRLYWIFVWIKREDQKMLDQELAYIDLLIKNKDELFLQYSSLISNDFHYSSQRWVFQEVNVDEDIKRSKERYPDIRSLVKAVDSAKLENLSEVCTALRLCAIGYGVEEDLLPSLKVLSLFEKLNSHYINRKEIVIERALTLGNLSLDFSRFRMVRAYQYNRIEMLNLIEKHPIINELKIGYACLLRNGSILYSETGDMQTALELIDALWLLSEELDSFVTIQEELARALSNSITSILSYSKEHYVNLGKFFDKISSLYQKYPDSKKIKGAFVIAKKSLNR